MTGIPASIPWTYDVKVGVFLNTTRMWTQKAYFQATGQSLANSSDSIEMNWFRAVKSTEEEAEYLEFAANSERRLNNVMGNLRG